MIGIHNTYCPSSSFYFQFCVVNNNQNMFAKHLDCLRSRVQEKLIFSDTANKKVPVSQGIMFELSMKNILLYKLNVSSPQMSIVCDTL